MFTNRIFCVMLLDNSQTSDNDNTVQSSGLLASNYPSQNNHRTLSKSNSNSTVSCINESVAGSITTAVSGITPSSSSCLLNTNNSCNGSVMNIDNAGSSSSINSTSVQTLSNNQTTTNMNNPVNTSNNNGNASTSRNDCNTCLNVDSKQTNATPSSHQPQITSTTSGKTSDVPKSCEDSSTSVINSNPPPVEEPLPAGYVWLHLVS